MLFDIVFSYQKPISKIMYLGNLQLIYLGHYGHYPNIYDIQISVGQNQVYSLSSYDLDLGCTSPYSPLQTKGKYQQILQNIRKTHEKHGFSIKGYNVSNQMQKKSDRLIFTIFDIGSKQKALRMQVLLQRDKNHVQILM